MPRLPLKKISLGLAVALVAIQFVRPEKNLAVPAPFAGKDDITALYPPPPDVRQTLAVACYDCHSDRTRYPWYANVQPLAWWLDNHIRDGKRQLNFTAFGALPPKRQAKKLDALLDEVQDRAMPLPSYTWAHRDAKLTDAQIKAFAAWVDSIQEKLGDK